MTTTRVMVVGGCGYIGSVLVQELVNQGARVEVVDDLSYGQNIPPHGVTLYREDAARAFMMPPIFPVPPDVIINLAALASVPICEEKPPQAYMRNCGTAAAVAKYAAIHHIPLIYASTGAVYADSDKPRVEYHLTAPSCWYGVTKYVGEVLSLSLAMYSVALRFFNVVGDKNGISDVQRATTVFPRLMRSIMTGEEFTMTGHGHGNKTRDSTTVRDYIYVGDITQGILASMVFLMRNKREQTPVREVFNLGTEKGTTLQELIDEMEFVTGGKVNMVMGEPRPGDAACYACDASKAKELLGWEAKTEIAESIRSMLPDEHPGLEITEPPPLDVVPDPEPTEEDLIDPSSQDDEDSEPASGE